MENNILIKALLIVLIAAVALYFFWPHPAAAPVKWPDQQATTTGTAATSSSSYTLIHGSEAESSVEAVHTEIAGTWRDKVDSEKVIIFNTNGAYREQIGGQMGVGSWQLFSSLNPPADLAHLTLEPDHVFLRTTLSGVVHDYMVMSVTNATLEMVKLGAIGNYSFVRQP